MIKIKKIRFKFLLVLLALSLFIFPLIVNFVASDGLGVVPGVITLDNRLKGATYIRQITIFNSRDAPILFDLVATGDLESWVTFYTYENRSAPITSIRVDYEQRIIVEFKIPLDIANGVYEGIVQVKTNREEKTERGATVNLMFPVEVSIGVTGTQILTGEVSEIKTKDIEVGYPLEISFYFVNTGNVVATPTVIVNITRDGFPIDNFEYSDTDIPVDDGSIVSFEWKTINREPGKYKAHVTVLLGENILAEKDLPFELLPRGTFTRKGELLDISYSGKLEKDQRLIIEALFKNTGVVETTARFMGEVYRDGNLIEILEGAEEVTVNAQETYTFKEYLEIKATGKYQIKGYVQYENNRTAMQSLSFEVKGLEIGGIAIEIILLVGIAIIGVGAGIRTAYILIIKPSKTKRAPLRLRSIARNSRANKPILPLSKIFKKKDNSQKPVLSIFSEKEEKDIAKSIKLKKKSEEKMRKQELIAIQRKKHRRGKRPLRERNVDVSHDDIVKEIDKELKKRKDSKKAVKAAKNKARRRLKRIKA